ncbi:MAG: SDR family oxidoreductase [Allorhizobium sp.]
MTKTVFITGASSGIGKASAKFFQEKGWNVVATMRTPEKESELDQLDHVLLTRLDVQDPQSIHAAVEGAISRFGRIDVLVNNAGYGLYGVFEAVPRDRIQQQFDVNVFGVMDVTRALLPHFRSNRAGTIVNVSSGAGHFTLPMISLYCASKFALEGFTEALSYELLELDLGVKLVVPHGGVAETAFQQRSAADFADANTPTDYRPFLERSTAAFARMGGALTMTPRDVANVVHEAATDGTSRLRYFVGDDARGFVKARREMADQDYVDFMRSHFA